MKEASEEGMKEGRKEGRKEEGREHALYSGRSRACMYFLSGLNLRRREGL